MAAGIEIIRSRTRSAGLIFEICVDSVAGVRAARAAGAGRVELCADLLEGGTTPSRGMIRRARTVAGIGLHVIIRPRGGDFLFDDDEFAVMEADIDTAKDEGADGVVIGLLKPDGTIDAERTRALVARARPLSVTFHRAFDMTPDPFGALETLIGLGVDRVLTSGQEATRSRRPAADRGAGRSGPATRIIVMPGGGITARNAERIVAAAQPAGDAFRGAGAAGRRHAVPPGARLHGRRAAPAGIRPSRHLGEYDPLGDGEGVRLTTIQPSGLGRSSAVMVSIAR